MTQDEMNNLMKWLKFHTITTTYVAVVMTVVLLVFVLDSIGEGTL